MRKIIFFVGPDSSGKTNIATALSKLLSIPVFKLPTERDIFKRSSMMALQYIAPTLYEICKQTHYSYIFDRGYPCEYAYSRAYDRETDEQKIWDLDEKYSELGAEIIYCYKTKYDNALFKDELVKKEEIGMIKKYYEEFLNETKCQYLMLDTTSEDLPEQLDTIISFIFRIKFFWRPDWRLS